jgi:hypothetical protein
MQINWGEVGQKMTNAISAEIQDRQSRKDEIDKQLNDYQKNLLDQPQGTNAEVNRFMGDFTSDAGDAMRQAERLLKGGNLSERDFYKFRANANQGTDLMFQAAKNFNEGYDESMRRFADGESQSKENWMRQQTEGYLNFANNGAYINPLTGEVNVARRNKETGEISTKPGDFANVSELVQQSKAKYNKFDLQGSINASVKGLTQRLVQDSDGTTTKQFYQALQDGTLGEAEQKLLNDAKRDLVDSYTVNPDNVSSILTENVGVSPSGTSYDFTYDEEEAKKNDHLILVNPDGTNNFDTPNGKKQLAAAKKYAEGQFEASLGGERKDRQELTEAQEVSADQRQQQLDETKRANKARERAQALRDKKANAKAGDVIFADPNEAFEAYIVADKELEKDAKGIVIGGVNADLLSDKTNNTFNQEDASKQVIAPLVAKFGDLGFSFTLDNTSDFFTVVGPSGGEGIRIDYDEQASDALEEYQRLMSFIRGEFVDPNVLQSKYSVIGYDRFGPGSVFVDESGRPISKTDSTGSVVDYSQK